MSVICCNLGNCENVLPGVGVTWEVAAAAAVDGNESGIEFKLPNWYADFKDDIDCFDWGWEVGVVGGTSSESSKNDFSNDEYKGRIKESLKPLKTDFRTLIIDDESPLLALGLFELSFCLFSFIFATEFDAEIDKALICWSVWYGKNTPSIYGRTCPRKNDL